MTATDLLAWGMVAHLVADWLLQNEWMALKKTSLKHPAAWVHGTIHLVALAWVFDGWTPTVLALVHILIDTRIPLAWWRRVFGQTTEGPMAAHVAIWGDQVAHVACIAVAARVCG